MKFILQPAQLHWLNMFPMRKQPKYSPCFIMNTTEMFGRRINTLTICNQTKLSIEAGAQDSNFLLGIHMVTMHSVTSVS